MAEEGLLRRCARELGHRFGALGDGVLGEFAGEDEADRGLDLTRRDGRLLRVRGELCERWASVTWT
jgi:hypothetical protein